MQIRSDNGLEFNINFVLPQSPHFHDTLELLYLIQGSAEIKTETDTWLMKTEDIIVINSGILHQICVSDTSSMLCRVIIPRNMIAHSLERELFLIWCNSVVDNGNDFEDIRVLLREIIRHCLIRKNADLYFQGKIFQLMHLLTESYLITNEDVRYQQHISKNDERIQQILSYIHENYNKDITLNELADKLYLTNAYLSRSFKKFFGMNFGEYLNYIKLHHAAEDLLYTSKSITRIAMDNGFSNMGSFNRNFKVVYQMTPKSYREQAGKNSKEDILQEIKQQKILVKHLKDFMLNTKDKAENIDMQVKTMLVQIDVLDSYTYKKPWSKLINVGTVASLRDYRVRSELLRLNSSLKFTYARVWNILSDAIMLGHYISDEQSDYDFTYLDECIDFLLQNHLKPFLQMGYKRARGLYSEKSKEITVSIMSEMSYHSLEEYLKVLNIVLKHLFVRYGQEEMNTWCFEIWHPNMMYRLPDIFCTEGRENFSKNVYHMIRKMLPNVKIGGAEFSLLMESNQLYEDISFYQKANIEFDFITCVSFTYTVSKENGELKRHWSADSDFMRKELENLKKVLNKTGWGNLPIWVTEYSFSLEHRNPLNDTIFKGAYILKNMSDILGLADVAGYWLLSDVYSEGDDSNRLLYGGSGIVTKDGINKPVYYALYFLANMKPLLVSRGKNYLLTTDGSGIYTMICHNMKELNYLAFLKNEKDMQVEDINYIFLNQDVIQIKIVLKQMTAGKYRVKHLKLDENHGDIQAWVKENYTGTHLKRQEIWHLQQACMPEMSISEEWVNNHNEMVLKEILKANDFMYIEIERMH